MTDVDLFGDPIPPTRTGAAGLDPPRVRNTDPHTSSEAAESLGERSVGARCQELYALIHHYGGLTTHQLVALTGHDRGNTARRITDLHQAGWIKDSGVRRLGPTGRRSIVWEPVQSGAA
jgi:hypothetical protein